MKLIHVFKNFAVGAAFLASGEELEDTTVNPTNFPTDNTRIEQPQNIVRPIGFDKPFG